MIDKLVKLIQDSFTWKDDRGASAVEYGLLIAGIAALIAVAVFALGPIVRGVRDDLRRRRQQRHLGPTATPELLNVPGAAEGAAPSALSRCGAP